VDGLFKKAVIFVLRLSNIVYFKQNTATFHGVLFSQVTEQLEILLYQLLNKFNLIKWNQKDTIYGIFNNDIC